jgi:oligopeptide transport system substrate-binding protein
VAAPTNRHQGAGRTVGAPTELKGETNLMTSLRSLSLALAAGASALTLAACGGQAPDDGVTVLHRGNNAEPFSLDPHKASGTWENNIVGDMFIGLFTENAAGEPILGMAESYEVSEDGLSWTFTLREASWSDGEPVDAYDFEFALRRILAPETLANYASVLYPIRNARGVNAGDLAAEELGVTAVDARTLRIDLEFPAPYLPQLLTHYTSFPVPQHVVEQYGDAWIQPANIETNGPYKLVQWSSNNFVHVERNPFFFDNENVCIDEVFYYPTELQAAERRVRSGELHLTTDFAGQSYDFLRQEIPDYVRVNDYLGVIYFSFNTTQAPFDDPRVRNALGMALDTRFIAEEIMRTGQTPAHSFVPPFTANYPATARISWFDDPIEERRVRARELLEEAGFGPENPLRFEYTHRSTGDNPRVAPVVQSDWESIADWVNVDILQIDTQIHYSNLRAGDYTVGDGGWIGDYNDAYNFLFLAETESVPMNYTRWSNDDFDALVAQANVTVDGAERGRLLAEAEQIMLDELPYVPIVYYVNKALVDPNVTGWEDNITHIHRTRFLCFADESQSAEVSGEVSAG